MKFRVNDSVVVIAGASRGMTGAITKINLKTNKVLVEGINKKIRHIKGQSGQVGQKVEIFAPIDISNIAVVGEDGKPTRIGYKIEAGEKVRIAKRSGKILPKNTKAPKTAKKTDSKKAKK